MAINTDGQRRQGRFLKRGSKLLKSVRMTEFSFEQIRQASVISFDNPDRSIIHAKFHEKSEIDDSVKAHETFDDVLVDPSHPSMGVIYPGDFTQDWHNQRLNNKRRALGFEDEDDFDLPMEARAVSKGAAVVSSNPAPPPSTTNHVTSSSDAIVETIIAQPTNIEAVRATTEEDGSARTISPVDMSAAISKAFNPSNPELVQVKEESKDKAPEMSVKSPMSQESQEFIPLDTSRSPGPRDAEDRAMETWKLKADIKEQSEALLEQLKSEAKSEGYQDGFRMGEEKGVLSGQQAAAAIFGKVQELILEFSNLKHLVLDNVQDNFYELSQAMGEALLEREFSVKPETYGTVLSKIIKDTVPSNEFKIKMHPETWQKLTNLRLETLENHLVKDPSIPVGEFRIESNLSVVDVNVKKIISQLLQNVDMDVFQPAQKAG